jgi:hypothetical protein
VDNPVQLGQAAAVAPRRMRDSTTVGDIPVPGTQLVMVYGNGDYTASAAEVAARFPGIPVVWLDVLGTDPHADGLDVENGDATVPTAVSWTRSRLLLRPAYPPLIYCNRSTLTPLFNAMAAAGLKIVRDFRLGIATLDGTTTVPDMTGVTFVQDRGTKLTGGHWDESAVYDPAFKAPPAPPPWPPQALAITRGLAADVAGLEQLLAAHQ